MTKMGMKRRTGFFPSGLSAGYTSSNMLRLLAVGCRREMFQILYVPTVGNRWIISLSLASNSRVPIDLEGGLDHPSRLWTCPGYYSRCDFEVGSDKAKSTRRKMNVCRMVNCYLADETTTSKS